MYRKLFTAIAINTVIMFLLTYVMIDTLDHFHFNINKVYMALMMAAPMVIVMLVVMRSMYEDTRRNYTLIIASAALFLTLFILVRSQAPVGNQQFLRSMIPHHSSAILMCQEAAITDQEISLLCDEIIQTQREEIDQMEAILDRMR